jgi:hypothetical protein
MTDFAKELKARYESSRSKYSGRDHRMNTIRLVRQGRMQDVHPEMFPAGPLQGGIVANMIDVAAHDLSEVLAPLPTFNCASSKNVSDTARKFAERRTLITRGYIQHSDVSRQMYQAADQYFSYGGVPAIVEVDAENRLPRITFMDALGAYPVFDRWGQTREAFFTLNLTRGDCMAMYPECARVLKPQNEQWGASDNDLVNVVRFHSAEKNVLFLPDHKGFILEMFDNPAGECLVEWTMRPSVDGEPRGQFDDVIGVQVAKSRMALLALEAANKSVQAPLVLPPDAQELSLGPDSVLRTASAEKVRRIPLEVPASAFAEQGMLDSELRSGSRYPEARTGNVESGVVTGRGVQALMGGFDTQIRTGQAMFAKTFELLLGKALRLDEKLWGDVERTMRGNNDGTPYEIKYRPSKDIKGDHTVDVQYGLLAGLDPNRALVFGLQARGDKLISRDFLRRQMPFSLDATQEEQMVDIEEMRDSLKQAVSGYAQSIPALAQAGQDPGQVLSIVAKIIEGRESGMPIEKVVSKAFTPPEPTPEELAAEQAQQAAMGGDPMMGGGPGPGPGGALGGDGLNPDGTMRGVAPGQQGMAPGGRPDLNVMLASLGSNGQPNLSAGVSRRVPV